jgi:dTDP-4-amino-4,6-dideoxygalactose transaminase
MHLQPASKIYGYKKGDFPVAESISDTTISLPVHEFLSLEQINFIIKKIKQFYNEN